MPLSQTYFVVSALLLALGSVLSKLLLSMDQSGAAIDPLPFLTLQLMGGVAFLVIVRTALGWPRMPRQSCLRPALAGLILGVGSVGTIMALALISASEASVVFATQPVVILVLARLVLDERCGASTAILGVAAVVGVVIIVLSGGIGEADGRTAGIAFAILSTVSAAVYVIWMRGLSGKTDVLTALIIVLTVACVLALGVWGLANLANLTETRPGPVSSALAAFGTGMMYYGAAFYVYLLGLRHTEASVAGIYLSLVPVFVIALAGVLLDERLTPVQWLGAAIVVSSVAGVSILSAMARQDGSEDASERRRL